MRGKKVRTHLYMHDQQYRCPHCVTTGSHATSKQMLQSVIPASSRSPRDGAPFSPSNALKNARCGGAPPCAPSKRSSSPEIASGSTDVVDGACSSGLDADLRRKPSTPAVASSFASTDDFVVVSARAQPVSVGVAALMHERKDDSPTKRAS
jgi:hypothetical protein